MNVLYNKKGRKLAEIQYFAVEVLSVKDYDASAFFA